MQNFRLFIRHCMGIINNNNNDEDVNNNDDVCLLLHCRIRETFDSTVICDAQLNMQAFLHDSLKDQTKNLNISQI